MRFFKDEKYSSLAKAILSSAVGSSLISVICYHLQCLNTVEDEQLRNTLSYGILGLGSACFFSLGFYVRDRISSSDENLEENNEMMKP